jgi:hypothetical protein
MSGGNQPENISVLNLYKLFLEMTLIAFVYLRRVLGAFWAAILLFG